MLIAFLGLGRMGTPMARQLLQDGHDLVVWNRTPSRSLPLVAEGARAATTPSEAVAGATTVITMLADPPAVRAVVAEVAGVLEPDCYLIEMSTVGPAVVRDLAQQVPALVDAPVMGSVQRAAAGHLTVLAGGDLGPVESVLSTFGRVVHCGPLGSGAALKLVLTSAVVAGVALVGEMLALADELHVPEEQAIEMLAAGPLGGAVARSRSHDSDFPVRLAAKDLDLAAAAATQPMVAAARDLLRRYPGIADADLSRVVGSIRSDLECA